VVSLLSEGLAERGVDVTLFATKNSRTRGRLAAVCAAPWEEDPGIDPKVWECLHIAHCFEHAREFERTWSSSGASTGTRERPRPSRSRGGRGAGW
jgi:hypothetical protein